MYDIKELRRDHEQQMHSKASSFLLRKTNIYGTNTNCFKFLANKAVDVECKTVVLGACNVGGGLLRPLMAYITSKQYYYYIESHTIEQSTL